MVSINELNNQPYIFGIMKELEGKMNMKRKEWN